MSVPEPFTTAFNLFDSGAYERYVDEIEPVFYSEAKLERDPGLRFRRDIPPFLCAGRIQPGKELVLTWGINPKPSPNPKAKPRSADEYWDRAFTAFDSDPSPFHKTYLHLLKGLFGMQWLESWSDVYATFDMVPWYSDRWSVGTLTKKRVELIRPHLQMCRQFLQGTTPRLTVFNGTNWVDLLKVTPAVFGSKFRERGRVDYASVTDKTHRGAVLVGEICLSDRPVPALVMTWFIHGARPPFSYEELSGLGETLRERFDLGRER